MEEFFEALKTLKVGERAVFDGIDDVKIEVVEDDETENVNNNDIADEEYNIEAEEKRLEKLLKEAFESGDYEVYINDPKTGEFRRIK